jgi:hypothetical protein
VLAEKTDMLDEIFIDYAPPITVRKDTITYKVDSFVSGNESKLQDLLINLTE